MKLLTLVNGMKKKNEQIVMYQKQSKLHFKIMVSVLKILLFWPSVERQYCLVRSKRIYFVRHYKSSVRLTIQMILSLMLYICSVLTQFEKHFITIFNSSLRFFQINGKRRQTKFFFSNNLLELRSLVIQHQPPNYRQRYLFGHLHHLL